MVSLDPLRRTGLACWVLLVRGGWRAVAFALGFTLLLGVVPGAPLSMWSPPVETVEEPAPLPPEVSDRPGSARVVVLDATNSAPLGGATVRALFLREGVVYLAARGTTGADGAITLTQLPLGVHWLVADAPSHARGSTQRFVGADPAFAELRLGAERALEIVVRDEAHKPVAGAEIEVLGVEPMPRGARTDAQGIARPHGLAVGPLKVTARAAGWDAVTSTVCPNEARVTLVLHRLGTLLVSVVGEDGVAAKGALVAIAGGALAVPRTTTADEKGEVRVSGLGAGSYDLRATLGTRVSKSEIGVYLPRGAEAKVRLVLTAGRMVRVSVKDENGAVIPGAEVVGVEGGISPFPQTVTADANGVAVLGPFAPGGVSLAAQAKGFWARGPIAVPESNALEVVLRRAATLLGDVKDAKGRPIDGATVEVVGADLDGAPVSVSPATLGFSAGLLARARGGGRTLLPVGELGVVPGPVPPIPRPFAQKKDDASAVDPWVTRFDGTFRATPVPAGKLRAIVRHPAYVEGISAPVDLAPGGEAKVSVVLAAGGRLVGTVKDEKGYAVAGAWIEVTARAGSLARGVRTATDGTFAIAAVPGEVTITLAPADRPNDVALRTEVTVPEGETTTVDLVLPAPRPACVVRVIDDRRYPLKGAQVTIASLDPAAPIKRTGFTDARGEVEIPRVSGLRVQVEVRASGHATTRLVQASLPASLEVELAAGFVAHGVVMAPGGRVALAGATVTLAAEDGVRRTLTGKDGKFQFADVPRGEASLDVRASGAAPLRKTVTLAPVGSLPEVDLGRLELGAAGSVEGTVVDAKGKPVAGARVARDHAPTWIPAGGVAQPGVAVTDAYGAFKLADVAVGDVFVEAFAADTGRGRTKVRIDEGRATTNVKIVLDPVPVAGEEILAPGGVAITLAAEDTRVMVAAVAVGSEAERAGVLEGDELVSIDGTAATSLSVARAHLGGPLGVDVLLTVKRKGTNKTLRVVREATRR